MLYEIGQKIPKPVAELGASVFVKINRLRGANRLRYNYDGFEFVYGYQDTTTFTNLHDCIDVEKGCTALEGIPLSYFELSDHDAAFDVGAHFGIYTVIIGRMNPNLPIFAFEPNRYNRLALEFNTALNDFDSSRIKISDTVISSETGLVTFYEDKSINGSPRDTLTPGQDSEKFTTTVERESKALSDVFASEGIKKPFVKLDIEGAEDRVIADLLSADIERLAGIVEIHSNRIEGREYAILNQFEDYGVSYELVKKDPKHRQGYYFDTS